jgi:methylenetetrahydrofolate reductase (NADPH)
MTELLVSTSADLAADAFLARTARPSGSSEKLSVSFEFFPPKTAAMEEQLWQTIRRLSPLQPSFMSVTCGANGSTRDGTLRTVKRIQGDTGTPAAAHLTCVDLDRDDIDSTAESYWTAGIRHIVALRGDAVRGEHPQKSHQNGYAFADSLVRGLRGLRPFEISVAAYPETHPEAQSPQADIDALKRKIDAGATRAITQFFFDIDAFARFLERAQRAGIDVPIVPGILPITKFEKAAAFAKACHVKIPAHIQARFEGLDDDPDTLQLVAAAVAAEQCSALGRLGIRQFHFYTLNRAELSFATCHVLGIRPAKHAEATLALSA